MNPQYAKKLIDATAQSYDTISDLFSATRQYNWEEIKKIVHQYAEPRQNIIDIGCGNGRLYNTLRNYDTNYLGIDISSKLITEAKKLWPQANFQIGDFFDIPVKDNSIDIIFAIAFFHHIPSEQFRQQALLETHRILKPSGLFIMTNWNLYQPKYEQYINSNFQMSKDLDENDALIPWKNPQGQKLTDRYYHAFTLEEIKNLLKSNNLKVIRNYQNKYNLITISQK
ncbi:methyltransferase domain-containing protein [Patescibacteria group bacterium]|nr:methyltransferase domain-containing protein [Patescibacteria group bacterium]